jgi:hypothetical protein
MSCSFGLINGAGLRNGDLPNGFGRYEVHIRGGELHGTAWGELNDITRHQPAVKSGATCTGLRVAQAGNGTWAAGVSSTCADA